MTTGWSFVTAHARVLLCYELEPAATIREVADTLQMSYRWTVDATSDLLAAGFLQRERHGRSFAYLVTSAVDHDLDDQRAAEVQQLSYALAGDVQAPGDDREADLSARLSALRRQIVIDTEHLQRVRAEARQIESTIERVRSLLRHPTLRVG